MTSQLIQSVFSNKVTKNKHSLNFEWVWVLDKNLQSIQKYVRQKNRRIGDNLSDAGDIVLDLTQDSQSGYKQNWAVGVQRLYQKSLEAEIQPVLASLTGIPPPPLNDCLCLAVLCVWKGNSSGSNSSWDFKIPRWYNLSSRLCCMSRGAYAKHTSQNKRREGGKDPVKHLKNAVQDFVCLAIFYVLIARL